MADFQLWHGGKKMGTRDLWSTGGSSYWPNSVADPTAVYGYGFSGHQSDGRSFHAERQFAPSYEGDEALLSYLTQNVATPAIGDRLMLMLIPRGSRVESFTAEGIDLPAGLTGSVVLVNTSTNAETALLTLASTDNGTVKTYATMLNTGTVNHMLAFKVTAVPAGWTASNSLWSNVRFHLNAVGQDTASGHPILETAIATVP